VKKTDFSRFDHAMVNLGRVRFYTSFLVRQKLLSEQDAVAMCHRFYDHRPELAEVPFPEAVKEAMRRRDGAFKDAQSRLESA